MNIHFSSKNQKWATRWETFDPLNKKYNFTLDPCAEISTTKCKKFFTKETDGLMQSWQNETAFVNPPYGKYVPMWMHKAFLEWLLGDCEIVMLIASRTGTNMFHNYLWDSKQNSFRTGVNAYFCDKRITFGSDEYWLWVWNQSVINGKPNKLYKNYGKMNPAPFDSLIVHLPKLGACDKDRFLHYHKLKKYYFSKMYDEGISKTINFTGSLTHFVS